MRANNEGNACLTSFLDYTCESTRILNRGGLYEINDIYLLVKEIEAIMQVELIDLLKRAPLFQEGQARKLLLIWYYRVLIFNFIGALLMFRMTSGAKNC